MGRAFTAADVVQGATATPGAFDIVTVSLPAATTELNSGLLVMGAQTDISPPRQWHSLSRAGFTTGSHQLAIMIRPDLLGGEQSWDFQTSSADPVNPGGVAFWCWRVEEWTNLAFTPCVGTSSTFNSTPSLASISTGTTVAWDASLYVVGIAAVLMLGNAGGAAWPDATFSNGFDVTQVIDEGIGDVGDDLRLWVARRYGTAGETGGWETTATFSGTVTGKTPMAALAVFRAEAYVGEI